MKIEIPHSPLTEAMIAIDRVSGKNMALPVLAAVSIEAKRSGLILRATNLELGVERMLPAKVTEEGVVCVPSSLMANTISHLRGTTPVRIESDDTTLVVSADGGKARLRLIPPEEFPTLPRVSVTPITLSGAVLARVLKAVAYCASPSTIKPELGSVYVHSKENSLIGVATDSFRLAEKIVPLPAVIEVPPMLIPIRSVGEVTKILEEIGEDTVELSAGEHQMAIASPGIYLTSRLVEGTFPEYRKILPTTTTTEVTMLKADILHTLRKASVFADKFNQVTLTIDPKGKTVGVFTKNSEVGEVTDTISATVTGDAITMSFNLRYVIDAFQSIMVDSVSFSFSGVGKPMVIRGVTDASFTYLVMPMNR